jgi:aldehyde dehydrogenase (NAD+)
MSFRTPDEAIALANNTRYGLAASVWSESIGLAMETASRLQAGVVWINSTNLFDAASGFGGYRESGFGREGGREGMWEYLRTQSEKAEPMASPETAEPEPSALPVADAETSMRGLPGIDRTAKLYIGGKQARPDSGYSYTVLGADGHPAGQAGLGNRKDIRNAVEAAHQAKAWGAATGHNRAQVLYYLAENLAARAVEFEARVASLTGAGAEAAEAEVSLAIRRMFYYAAQADKFDGAVHATRTRNVTLAMVEPWGVMGIICPDEAPLLGFVSLVLPALALGNRVIAVPSSRHALIATDLYQVFDTSDLPPGVINIVTGARDELAKILAQHDDVAALWYVGSHAGSTMVERESAGNLKATWVSHGRPRDWLSAEGQGPQYLRRASQVKNIWVPYGE